MIAFCGLNCAQCPTFPATPENSDEQRKQVAQLWSEQLGAGFAIGNIDCEGCLSKNGRLFSYCANCKIRRCCGEKQVENCARCDDGSCQKPDRFLQAVPRAKTNPDEIRKTRKQDFLEKAGPLQAPPSG